MITCFIQYEIVPEKLSEFETYARLWVSLVEKFGGIHHGYYLPHESANDMAVALFSFSTLAAYEQYRLDSLLDEECQQAYQYAEQEKCIRRYDRQFLRRVQ